MKVPRDGSENQPETRKGYERMSFCGEGKAPEENKKCCGDRGEECDFSGCGIEPSATPLIPPWLRNSLGLAEKGDVKQNQKCLKIHFPTADRSPWPETVETKTDTDGDCLKCHFYIQDSPSTNPILEVNIGSEADFLKESAEKLSSPWKSKSGRHNQYECNFFGITNEREMPSSVKSEVTSIDVVVPLGDLDEEKRKLKVHKGKSRMRRRTSNGCFKSEDNLKNDAVTFCKSTPRDFSEVFFEVDPLPSGKNLDGRLLLLCGKKAMDNLTQDDVVLLQEMKNQVGHKEGFEKLFSEIRDTAFAEKETRKVELKEEKEYRRDAIKGCDKTMYPHGKSEESRILNKNRVIDDERKYLEDLRKHNEKKNRNQQRQMKYIDEPEVEKDKKWKGSGQKTRDTHAEKEKKTKLRHCEYSVIEKAVNETLQKFIDLHRVQVPPDVVSSMKKNIIQTLQSEYQETNGPKRGLEAVLAVQDQLRNVGVFKCSVHHLLMEEREDKEDKDNIFNTEVGAKRLDFTSKENVVSKDIPVGETDISCKMKRDIEKSETLIRLRKDFERCLELIQYQLDVTGTRLSSVVMEKMGTEDKKLRIVHNFANGLTESIKMYDRVSKGSPEGDTLNTAVCEFQQNFVKTKRDQMVQTKDKTYGKAGTQTDWVNVSVQHLRNADLTPGLYRITKATESGRFYLTPEALEDDDYVEEENNLKRVSSEMCVRLRNESFMNTVVKYISRETCVSERGNVDVNKPFCRAFKSDCLGLNNLHSGNLTQALTENRTTGGWKGRKGQEEQELADIEVGEGVNMEASRNFVSEMKKKAVTAMEKPSNPESYHKGCVWLWNGKKMSPGIDLKVHVENLLREKLNEILCETRGTEQKNESQIAFNPSSSPEEKGTSTKNLEIRKTEAKFCITNEDGVTPDPSPFVFKAAGQETTNFKTEDPLNKIIEPNFGKSVREVGTQNSEHTILSLNNSKVKPRSKLCTVAKFSKRRQLNGSKLRPANSKNLETNRPYAENVGEAKKVKLEFREENEIAASNEKGSNSDSVRECYSVISNTSSSSNESPVRVKLIGIEVAKDKSPGDGDFCAGKNLEEKGFAVEGLPTTGKDEERKYKHWELIEHVLNRVNQKEKDILWNDIRDFVKKKIGRDINDEGAREVCIEIEQEVPKFAKGKASRMVVARGNYTRNEGDVEVEVDLTLDDLERILRHRQRKMRRRMNSQSQKSESKESSTSSDTITDCQPFMCRPFAGEDYITKSEVKLLKEHN